MWNLVHWLRWQLISKRTCSTAWNHKKRTVKDQLEITDVWISHRINYVLPASEHSRVSKLRYSFSEAVNWWIQANMSLVYRSGSCEWSSIGFEWPPEEWELEDSDPSVNASMKDFTVATRLTLAYSSRAYLEDGHFGTTKGRKSKTTSCQKGIHIFQSAITESTKEIEKALRK